MIKNLETINIYDYTNKLIEDIRPEDKIDFNYNIYFNEIIKLLLNCENNDNLLNVLVDSIFSRLNKKDEYDLSTKNYVSYPSGFINHINNQCNIFLDKCLELIDKKIQNFDYEKKKKYSIDQLNLCKKILKDSYDKNILDKIINRYGINNFNLESRSDFEKGLFKNSLKTNIINEKEIEKNINNTNLINNKNYNSFNFKSNINKELNNKNNNLIIKDDILYEKTNKIKSFFNDLFNNTSNKNKNNINKNFDENINKSKHQNKNFKFYEYIKKNLFNQDFYDLNGKKEKYYHKIIEKINNLSLFSKLNYYFNLISYIDRNNFKHKYKSLFTIENILYSFLKNDFNVCFLVKDIKFVLPKKNKFINHISLSNNDLSKIKNDSLILKNFEEEDIDEIKIREAINFSKKNEYFELNKYYEKINNNKIDKNNEIENNKYNEDDSNFNIYDRYKLYLLSLLKKILFTLKFIFNNININNITNLKLKDCLLYFYFLIKNFIFYCSELNIKFIDYFINYFNFIILKLNLFYSDISFNFNYKDFF